MAVSVITSPACVKSLSVVSDLVVTLWPITPLPMGFSRQGHWSGLPCPPPGDLSEPGMEHAHLLCLLHWQAARFFTTSATWETPAYIRVQRVVRGHTVRKWQNFCSHQCLDFWYISLTDAPIHHQLNGHEFEQALGDEGRGSLVCCSPWGHKDSDTT